MRAFVAVVLDASAKEVVSAAQRQIEANSAGIFRWADLDNIHLTLYFLGELAPEEFAAVEHRLANIARPPLSIGLGGLVLLPSPDVPKVLACGVIGDLAGLRSLQQAVHDAVFSVAQHKETRAFFPHVTFGRLKRGIPPSAKAVKRALTGAAVADSGLTLVRELVVFQSETKPAGAEYEALAKIDLGVRHESG